MKLVLVSAIKKCPPVAPYTGARIETVFLGDVFARCKVAPYTGARIETNTI
ncbi:hypothetical protein GCWU000246_00012 [Jonquetella anthropi E3_33 E1]|nr:hypothetical protein GCWU000246_00012 [Jonquetella anthropi E3_33 E1]